MTAFGLEADDYTETKVVIAGVELPFYLLCALTPVFNVMSRCPVLAVPSGIAPNGVPMGVEIVGRPYDDPTVFQVGAAPGIGFRLVGITRVAAGPRPAVTAPPARAAAQGVGRPEQHDRGARHPRRGDRGLINRCR